LLVTCAWTLFVWIVGIKNFVIGGNHTTGFRVVHTVLAVISIALGLAVGMIGWRARTALASPREPRDPELVKHQA